MKPSEIDKVLLPVPVEEAEKREEKVRSKLWPKLRAVAASIPFSEDVGAAYYCATDKKTPLKVRATLMAALAYFVMPLDTIPDLLAFVGFSDDLAVLTAAVTLIGAHMTDEHRRKAREALGTDLENDAPSPTPSPEDADAAAKTRNP
ncbi:MAG: YkvA family protein [Pseudomonadota bacterium]